MENICVGCEKLVNDVCSTYSVDGRKYRNRMGYCPVVDKYAEWREDKPKEITKKIRQGQQKQR